MDFQEGLLNNGAVDFYFTPVQMKKGRPGLKLSVLTKEADLNGLSNFILENSSTIGLRHYPVSRTILPRRHFEMETPYGPVQVKEVTTPLGNKRFKIEYESLRKIKEMRNISIPQLQLELYALLSKGNK